MWNKSLGQLDGVTIIRLETKHRGRIGYSIKDIIQRKERRLWTMKDFEASSRP